MTSRFGRGSATIVHPRKTAVQPLQSAALLDIPWVRHGVSRRVANLTPEDGNLGYGAPRDKASAWVSRQWWCRELGMESTRLVTVGQVHGIATVHVDDTHAGQGSAPGSGHAGTGDILLTTTPGVPLLTLHADCQPIIIADRQRPAVAVVHAGWRGTVLGVARAAVCALQERAGSDPADLVAWLGPAIGPCCYEVGPEVSAAWFHNVHLGDQRVFTPGVGDRSYLNLSVGNASMLQAAGVPAAAITFANTCTWCDQESWFSHRGQGPITGRFGAFVMIEAGVRA